MINSALITVLLDEASASGLGNRGDLDTDQDNTGLGIRRGKAYSYHHYQQGKLHDTDKHDDRLH